MQRYDYYLIHQIILKEFLIQIIIFSVRNIYLCAKSSPCMARNVIYLEWKTGFEFFGSPASMYDKHTDEELGINIHSLNNAFCKLRKENKPLEYVTKTGYIIRKGEIIMKETENKSKNYLGTKKKQTIQNR